MGALIGLPFVAAAAFWLAWVSHRQLDGPAEGAAERMLTSWTRWALLYIAIGVVATQLMKWAVA